MSDPRQAEYVDRISASGKSASVAELDWHPQSDPCKDA
jgi:hypothetical protein